MKVPNGKHDHEDVPLVGIYCGSPAGLKKAYVVFTNTVKVRPKKMHAFFFQTDLLLCSLLRIEFGTFIPQDWIFFQSLSVE